MCDNGELTFKELLGNLLKGATCSSEWRAVPLRCFISAHIIVVVVTMLTGILWKTILIGVAMIIAIDFVTILFTLYFFNKPFFLLKHIYKVDASEIPIQWHDAKQLVREEKEKFFSDHEKEVEDIGEENGQPNSETEAFPDETIVDGMPPHN